MQGCNHRSICKFEDKYDDNYRLIRNLIWEWSHQASVCELTFLVAGLYWVANSLTVHIDMWTADVSKNAWSCVINDNEEICCLQPFLFACDY